MKAKLFFTMLLLLSYKTFYAQNKISGSILNTKKESLPFIPVLLVSANDSLTYNYTVTDSTGRFSFQPKQSGTYFLKVKTIGYKEFVSSIISMNTINEEVLELNSIYLEEDANSLKEVIIMSKKPLFTQKTDRLVFNVQNSLASQGGDAIDALKNTPLLKVDDSSIAMIGKNNLNVLINGKPISLAGEALISYLSTISNDNISKIEIITTPPAKYAAEGNAGLINIILKKNPNLGFNGTLGASVTQRTYTSGRSNLALNYQTENFSMSSSLLYNTSKIAAYEKDQNRFDDGFFSNNRQDKIVVSNDFTPSINFNYKFNPKTDLSLIYEYSGSDYTSDDNSRNLFYDNSNLTNQLVNKGYGKVMSNFNRMHTFATHQLDTLGKSIEFGFQLLDNKIDNKRSNAINENSVLSSTQNLSLNNYRLGIANIDFNLPFKKAKVLTGAQYTFLDNTSDVQFFNIVNENSELNPNLTNAFNYNEKIGSVYISTEMDLNTKWTIQGGLRYEATQYEGKSVTSANAIQRDYENLFPTFYISYKFSEKANYSFKYSKRINRPRLEQLNPFQWFINPLQYVEGNPLLLPSYTDNVEFTFSNNSSLSASLYNSVTKGQVSYFAEFLEDGKIQRYSYYNVLDVYQYGVYANYAFTKINNLQTQLSGSYYWQKTKSDNTQLLPSTEGTGATISASNSYKFGKDNLVQCNYSHNFPSFDGAFYTDTFGFLTLGYRTSFYGKKLSLGLTASTIISNKSEISYSQVRENTTLNGQNEYDYQSIRVNLNYTFGNNKVKKSKIKNEAEESRRIK